MTSLPTDRSGQDIRGRRFDQPSLPQDLQGAIAGQRPLHKALLVAVLLLSCGLFSLLVGVLTTFMGMDIAGLGRFFGTFFESLTSVLVLGTWLLAATYLSWVRALGVMLGGVAIAVCLHALLNQLGILSLATSFFLVSTPITILVCWALYAMTFWLIRWAIATIDILFVQAARVRLLVLGVVVLGAIAGSLLGSAPDPHAEGGIPTATATEILLARLIGLGLTVGLALAGWGANRLRNIPWRYPDLLRDLALAWASVGSTSFRNLDLSQVNFAGATLANTDLRGRSLYRTCFRQAQRLDRARTDNRYLDLDNPKVQALLAHGTSADKDLRGLNLQGINLRQTADCPAADLQEIDFTGSNLSGADLRGANLSGSSLMQVNLVNADLSGATLTDACIQDWNINASTRFQGVICDRIFLRRSPQGHFLDPQPERGEFQPGDFETWIAAIQRSISLSFQTALNPQALAFALTQTALNYDLPDLLSVQRIDQQSGGATAQIDIAASSVATLDKAEVHQAIATQYQAAVQRLEAGYELTLQAKDAEVQHVRQLFASQQQMIERLSGQLAERSSPVVVQGEGNQIYMIQNAGGMTVTSNQNNINAGGNVDLSSGAKVTIGGDVVGSTINLGTLSGQVTTSIQQLRQVGVTEADQLADILASLQQAIDQDTALTDSQKKEALEAVETIAEEGQKPPEQRAAKLCAMAMNALKGVTATVSDVSKLATVLQSAAPALLTLLAL